MVLEAKWLVKVMLVGCLWIIGVRSLLLVGGLCMELLMCCFLEFLMEVDGVQAMVNIGQLSITGGFR